ncbi:hypothetical protein Hanom_Chr15g01383561 [Helianthus anomalus]
MVSTTDLLAISQSSILFPQFRAQVLTQGENRTLCYKVCTTTSTSCTRGFSLTPTSNLSLYRPISINQQSRNRFSSVLRGCVVSKKYQLLFLLIL